MPTAGDKDQVMFVLLLPVTNPENCLDWPPESDAVAGDTEIATTGFEPEASSEIIADEDLVESATLVAVSVTVWAAAMVVGAV